MRITEKASVSIQNSFRCSAPAVIGRAGTQRDCIIRTCNCSHGRSGRSGGRVDDDDGGAHEAPPPLRCSKLIWLMFAKKLDTRVLSGGLAASATTPPSTDGGSTLPSRASSCRMARPSPVAGADELLAACGSADETINGPAPDDAVVGGSSRTKSPQRSTI